MSVLEQATAARRAAYRLAIAPEAKRNAILEAMASLVESDSASILAENKKDTDAASANDLAQPLYKRLLLSDSKLATIASSLRSVMNLSDPLGGVETLRELDDGLMLHQIRVPIGVVGVIFESRPDAFVQIASLAIKSGNAVILKGGSEALHSNRCLHELFLRAIASVDPDLTNAIQLVETREDIRALLDLDQHIDLMIPRGSNELVRTIQESTRIPVLGHADGICHLYVHPEADEAMAVAIARDSKTQYPAVCNAIETLLVDSGAATMLTAIVASMPEVEFRGCERSREIVPGMAVADESDWQTEYNDLVLSVRIVDSVDEAIEHINTHGSHHTDAVVTANEAVANRFMREVDSSSTLWNASTRFADGFRYGLGAEVGISTGKIHARGPVGLEGLTTTQYRITGRGQIVADYAEGRKSFTHRTLDPGTAT